MDKRGNNVSDITVELWNHGTAGDTEKSCGEVCIFSVTGNNIAWDVIEALPSEENFFSLPTEKALRVECNIMREECGVGFEVINFSELPEVEPQ